MADKTAADMLCHWQAGNVSDLIVASSIFIHPMLYLEGMQWTG